MLEVPLESAYNFLRYEHSRECLVEQTVYKNMAYRFAHMPIEGCESVFLRIHVKPFVHDPVSNSGISLF